MNQRQRAMSDIVELCRRHSISAAEVAQALGGNPSIKREDAVGKFFGFLGGIFIFAGLGIYIGMFWDDFSSPMRILVTLGVGVSLHLLALLAARSSQYQRAATAMFLIASFMQAGGMAVFVHEVFPLVVDWQNPALIISALMCLEQLVTFAALRRGELLFSGLLFGTLFAGNFLDLAGLDADLIAATLGIALLFIAYGMERLQFAGVRGITYFAGSVMLLGGGFELIEGSPVEVLFIGLCSFLAYLSTRAQSKVLLFNATVGLLGYIGYFTSKHFVNSLGWPLALIVFGFMLFGISGAAIRLKQRHFGANPAGAQLLPED